jgi:uncharacterized protein YgbK (DUF1537 family)
LSSVILSDDLTGALEAGTQLQKKGFKVGVALQKEYLGKIRSDSDVIVFDTESRNVPPEQAFQTVKEHIEMITAAGLRLIYKKVDSTLRGNLGSEIAAALAGQPVTMAVFAPALPFNGRLTRNGDHYLHEVKLADSELARDPFAPVKQSFIPEIVREQTDLQTAVIDLNFVRRGAACLRRKIAELGRAGIKIAVIDAVTEDDLKMIALAVQGMTVLPIGSAGFLSHIFRASTSDNSTGDEYSFKNGPTLVISGSPAQVSKAQIDRAKNRGAKVIQLQERPFYQEGEPAFDGEQVVNLVVAFLKQGKNVVVDGAGAGKSALAAEYQNQPELLAAQSRKIQKNLSLLVKGVLERFWPARLMLIGGDTAYHVTRALGCYSIDIIGEVEPFVPLGRLNGKMADGMVVITKAGGFGSVDVINKACGATGA